MRLKSAVEMSRIKYDHTPSQGSIGSIHRSYEKTPLPDALKVQPQKADNVVQALQKEWQGLLNKSLFEYPIQECSIATKQSTIEEAIVKIKSCEIDFRTPYPRSKTALRQKSRK